jgi:glutathione synthase/RimK-type ligase-like ATP-grasp enzyme
VPDLLIASCAEALGRDDDEPLLVAALAARGVTARTADWADPAVDWSADLVLVRSTWDYARRRAEFLAWAERVEQVATLLNPAAVLTWNTDKTYLRDLAAAGVPVVPTGWVGPGDDAVAAVAAWPGDVVVKPAVSAGARDTARFAPADREAAVGHVRALVDGGRTAMVQPYLDRLDGEGETGLVYLDGAYSHAFGKAALLAAGPLGEGLFAEETITAREATAEQRALADRVAAWAADRSGGPLLYARVDLVPGADGAPQVIELELTEPSLNLAVADTAADRFADAVVARLG